MIRSMCLDETGCDKLQRIFDRQLIIISLFEEVLSCGKCTDSYFSEAAAHSEP